MKFLKKAAFLVVILAFAELLIFFFQGYSASFGPSFALLTMLSGRFFQLCLVIIFLLTRPSVKSGILSVPVLLLFLSLLIFALFGFIAPPFYPFAVFLFLTCVLFACVEGKKVQIISGRLYISVFIFSLTIAVADLVLRLKPVESQIKGGYFENKKSYGDLAEFSGREDLREYRHVTLELDSFGYRNNINGYQKPNRYILLGDSYVYNGTSWSGSLAGLIESLSGQPVYNISKPGISPGEEFHMFSKMLPFIKRADSCTLIWVLFEGNDLDNNYPSLTTGKTGSGYGIAEFQKDSPVRNMLKAGYGKFRDSRMVRIENQNETTILFYDLYNFRTQRKYDEIKEHPNVPMFVSYLQEMRSLTIKNNIDLKVVMIPAKEKIYNYLLDSLTEKSYRASSFIQLTEELCRKEGISSMDLGRDLYQECYQRWKISKDLLYWKDDTHLNDKGNAFCSELIFKHLNTEN